MRARFITSSRGSFPRSIGPVAQAHPRPDAATGWWVRAAFLLALAAAGCGDSPVAPAACGPIPDVTVLVGETASVRACFNDANGDALNYTATSSNSSVATASVAGTAITVRAVSPGRASITIVASDPGGLQAQQNVQVVVPNRAPEPRGTLPDITVRVGESSTVDLAQSFSDQDGETLTYGASSSDAAVARVTVSGSTVTVLAQIKGSTTVTVTASDPGGLSATQSFQMTVPNRPPAPVGAIGAQTIEVGQSVTVDVAGHFSDPDGDPLTYTAVSETVSVAGTSVSGSIVTITAARSGTTTITITASDTEQETATQQVSVTVPNRPPSAVGSVPAQTVEVGRSATVDVSQYFSDPDGDALAYSATSSSTSVARASVSGSTVTITGARAGRATITVTASDPEGLSATQQVAVTVPNRSPRRVGSVPAQTIQVGSSTRVNVSQYFSDPDGDALTYSATASGSGVARASASGSTVTITGLAAGSATITVTARDPGGLTATQRIAVTVPRPNRAPRSVGSVPAQTVQVGSSTRVNVSQYFSDPDGDALTYSATSSSSSVARASVSGSTVTITGARAGSATITVTARDPGGLSATQQVRVTVSEPNRRPNRVGSIPGQTVIVGQNATVNASQYFSDPDGDALTYSATSSSSSVARASVSGSTVTITGARAGSATITVTARDPGNLSATQRFSVRVESAGAPDLTVTVTPTSVSASPGDTVVMTFTIRNRGSAASSATTRRALQSQDATISTSDREMLNRPQRALAGGESDTWRIRVILSSQASGTLYYGVCVDAVAGESNTRNNCSPAFTVTVEGSAECTNDLGTRADGTTVRRTGSWDGSCRSVHYNNGEFARYYSFTLRERLSVTIDLASPSVDTWLALRRGGGTGTVLIESDDDGGAGTNSRIVRTLTAGTYTIEATTLLGGRTGPFTLTLAVGGGSTGPDLVFTGVSPRTQTVARGGTVRATFSIRNNGTAASNATTMRAYVSTDATISPTDTRIPGTLSLPSLSPNETVDATVSWGVSSTAPLVTVYWGICITSNTCSPSVRLTISASSAQSSTMPVPGTDALLRSLIRSDMELQGTVRIEPGDVLKGADKRSDSKSVGRSQDPVFRGPIVNRPSLTTAIASGPRRRS